jgi:hypothetical protein
MGSAMMDLGLMHLLGSSDLKPNRTRKTRNFAKTAKKKKQTVFLATFAQLLRTSRPFEFFELQNSMKVRPTKKPEARARHAPGLVQKALA